MRTTSARLLDPENRALVARSLRLEQRTSGNALGPPSLFCMGIALELSLGDETVLIDLETVSAEKSSTVKTVSTIARGADCALLTRCTCREMP